MIEFNGVYKNFRGVTALQNVSFRLQKDKVIGLIGFNGSGKTTAFNVIANLIDRFDGTVTYQQKTRDIAFYRRISFLSSAENTRNSNIVIQQLLTTATLYGTTKREALEIIYEIADKIAFKEFLRQRVRSLSKGNQQKLKIISIFLNLNAQIYILDEPFDGLDPIMVDTVSRLILKRCEGKCVVIASHRLEVVDQMCSEYYLLRKGKVVAHNTKSNFESDTKNKISILVNTGCELGKIKRLSFVTKIADEGKFTLIEIKGIDKFKKLATILIRDKKYKFHYLKKKSLSDNVFNQYQD